MLSGVHCCRGRGIRIGLQRGGKRREEHRKAQHQEREAGALAEPKLAGQSGEHKRLPEEQHLCPAGEEQADLKAKGKQTTVVETAAKQAVMQTHRRWE